MGLRGAKVRTTIDIPDKLYEALRRRAANEHTSIRSLIIKALAAKYSRRGERIPVVKPPIPRHGKPGRHRLDRENPYEFLFP
jgi:hypothetical protein